LPPLLKQQQQWGLHQSNKQQQQQQHTAASDQFGAIMRAADLSSVSCALPLVTPRRSFFIPAWFAVVRFSCSFLGCELY
jgi:hypothetical protein